MKLVSPTGFGEARIAGATTFYSSVDPATAEAALDLDVSSGSASDLGDDGVLVKKKVAKAHGWQVGDTVPAEFAQTGKHVAAGRRHLRPHRRLHRVGLRPGPARRRRPSPASGWTPTRSSCSTRAPTSPRSRTRIAAALADHPDTQVLDQEEFEKVASGFIDQLLTFVSVMLLLAVLIALLGIVNTLALSVHERTRELGLLRAVGATRGQVRAMVRWESVVISLIGALAGAVLGTGIGVALAQALKDEGIKAISVPVPQITLYVALAAVAGILAAVGPARSAARVDVLKAVVTD